MLKSAYYITIAVITVEPTGLLCLQLREDEAKGSIQWKMTPLPRLCVKTADNCDKSHLSFSMVLCDIFSKCTNHITDWFRFRYCFGFGFGKNKRSPVKRPTH